MHTLTDQPETVSFTPLPASQRIEALDAVRGFALLGICVMNIEFFNRPMADLGSGMPAGLQGLDWLASYFVAYFVAGKFWTIFATLFGMGFAVMLTRAERAGRSFLKPYMRRIGALAAFGAAHHIFLFAGDILFSYAVAAAYLLVVLYARTRWLVLALVLAIGVAFIPGANEIGGTIAFALAFSGAVALYLRHEKRVWGMPVISLILAILGACHVIAAIVFWAVPGLPTEPRWPVTIGAVLISLLAFLSARHREPPVSRTLRAGAAIYVLFACLQISGGAVDYFTTTPAPVAVAKNASAKEVAAAKKAADAKAVADKERAKRLKKRADDVAEETRVMSSGSYWELVQLRAAHFAEHGPRESGPSTLFLGMFLLGAWFIRAGIMENAAAHLPLFRKLAFVALPAGLALGIAGSLIATSHTPGVQHDGFGLASGMLMLGNLPACLGYIGLIVVMLCSRGALSKVRVLAPFGRMALTNYLTQSLVMSLAFLGHGLAWYGMGRANQLAFAACLLGAQIVFSHLWLSMFRYGPAEWLWRAITYMKLPAMRRERDTMGVTAAA